MYRVPQTDYFLIVYRIKCVEFGFNTSVIVNQLIDGENNGMGAIKNILAKVCLPLFVAVVVLFELIIILILIFLHYSSCIPIICRIPWETG